MSRNDDQYMFRLSTEQKAAVDRAIERAGLNKQTWLQLVTLTAAGEFAMADEISQAIARARALARPEPAEAVPKKKASGGRR